MEPDTGADDALTRLLAAADISAGMDPVDPEGAFDQIFAAADPFTGFAEVVGAGPVTLPAVRALAHVLHVGDVDKQGMPYVVHLTAVELYVADSDGTDHQRMAACLHDAVEDGHATLDQLRAAGLPDPVLDMIDALTHRPNEPRVDYIARILDCPDAVMVKYGDLNHNAGRLDDIPDQATIDRLRAKYARDLAQLDAGQHGWAVDRG